jgi:hypothetical protein
MPPPIPTNKPNLIDVMSFSSCVATIAALLLPISGIIAMTTLCEGEERLVVGRHSTFLSREEHGVAAGALSYKVEGEKHYIMRRVVMRN